MEFWSRLFRWRAKWTYAKQTWRQLYTKKWLWENSYLARSYFSFWKLKLNIPNFNRLSCLFFWKKAKESIERKAGTHLGWLGTQSNDHQKLSGRPKIWLKDMSSKMCITISSSTSKRWVPRDEPPKCSTVMKHDCKVDDFLSNCREKGWIRLGMDPHTRDMARLPRASKSKSQKGSFQSAGWLRQRCRYAKIHHLVTG